LVPDAQPTDRFPHAPRSAPPTLVQDARGFERLLGRLERAEEIAVDTEADSFFSYREKVCLIQITVGDEDFLVDPLARFDLTGFGAVLADPRKQKVFHDGDTTS
jgi:ribonuclease D